MHLEDQNFHVHVSVLRRGHKIAVQLWRPESGSCEWAGRNLAEKFVIIRRVLQVYRYVDIARSVRRLLAAPKAMSSTPFIIGKTDNLFIFSTDLPKAESLAISKAGRNWAHATTGDQHERA